MSSSNTNILRYILKWQLIILFFSIALKLLNKYYLENVVFYVLDYPGDETKELLWWQRWTSMERLGWSIIDYIEKRQLQSNI